MKTLISKAVVKKPKKDLLKGDVSPHLWWVVLLGRNGKIIYQTEMYKSKRHANEIAMRTASQISGCKCLSA